MGHVNNVAFCAYFEAGRIDFTSALLENGAVGSTLPMVIVGIKIDYQAQMHYPGNVEIGSRIARIGKSSFAVASAAFKNQKLFATADATLVHINPENGQSVPLTSETVRLLQESIAEPQR